MTTAQIIFALFLTAFLIGYAHVEYATHRNARFRQTMKQGDACRVELTTSQDYIVTVKARIVMVDRVNGTVTVRIKEADSICEKIATVSFDKIFAA